MNERINAISHVMNECQLNAKNAMTDANHAEEGLTTDGVLPTQHREIGKVWTECAEMLQGKFSLK